MQHGKPLFLRFFENIKNKSPVIAILALRDFLYGTIPAFPLFGHIKLKI